MRIQLKGKGKLLFTFQFLSLLCAILIIMIGLVTAVAYTAVRQRVAYRTNLKFEELTNTHVRELVHSFEIYNNALYATRGLFASAKVDANTWDSFIRSQSAPERFVGMKALAYAEVVPGGKINTYQQMLRNTQYKKISIHPQKKQGDYVVLTYHEDVSLGEPERLNALGFDLASDPIRNDAIKRAKSSNTMTATDLVSLASNGRTGFVFLLPLTDRLAGHNSSEPFGYSIAAFDMEKFIDSTIGTELAEDKTSMQITDVTRGQNTTLYRKVIQNDQYAVARDVTLQVADRTWKISFQAPSSSLVLPAERYAPKIILGLGTGLTIAICATVYILRLRYRLFVLVAAKEESDS